VAMQRPDDEDPDIWAAHGLRRPVTGLRRCCAVIAVGTLAAAVAACGGSAAPSAVPGASGHAATAAGDAPDDGQATGILGGLHTVSTVASTTPANGDENPYAVLVAPVTAGAVRKGDVLVDNFNAKSNRQGTGTTIVDVRPGGTVRLFAAIPQRLSGCPGGVGLTTAMAMLPNGWVVVGSTPSTGGTTGTAGAGCLIVLSPSGKVASVISGPDIDGPWDMTAVAQDGTAILLLTNTLIGVGAPGQPVVDRGDLVRITLDLPPAAAPSVTSTRVIASGFPEQASSGAFVVGPTGVAYEAGTAYVADPLAGSIVAVPDALSRMSPAGTGTTVASGGYLDHPLAMAVAPDGDLVVSNAENGDLVEVTTAGHQMGAFAVDPDPAQSPPGSGDLFGVAVAPSGHGVYFAKDDTNTLGFLH
jgi:hypothetical protein